MPARYKIPFCIDVRCFMPHGILCGVLSLCAAVLWCTAAMGQYDNVDSYSQQTGVALGGRNTQSPFNIKGSLGFSYNSTMQFGVGGTVAGYYYTQPRSPYISPSNVTLFADISFSGYYIFGVRGNNFFDGDRLRFDYLAYRQYMPINFWGIGYDNGTWRNWQLMYRTTSYVGADFLARIGFRAYLGPSVSFASVGARLDDTSWLDGQRTSYNMLSIGALATYDSHNLPAPRQKGVFLKLHPRYYPAMGGAGMSFMKVDLIADFYHGLWKGATLAYDLHADLSWGDVPWTAMPVIGSIYRMRGYYMGRYRDRNLVEAQVELRQKIWRRLGAVAWVGCGNVFPSPDEFNPSHTLPNWGVGYRWEVFPGSRVRLDFGMGKNAWGFIIGLNEAF